MTIKHLLELKVCPIKIWCRTGFSLSSFGWHNRLSVSYWNAERQYFWGAITGLCWVEIKIYHAIFSGADKGWYRIIRQKVLISTSLVKKECIICCCWNEHKTLCVNICLNIIAIGNCQTPPYPLFPATAIKFAFYRAPPFGPLMPHCNMTHRAIFFSLASLAPKNICESYVFRTDIIPWRMFHFRVILFQQIVLKVFILAVYWWH